MKEVTNLFNDVYRPQTALVIYEKPGGHTDVYVEAYEFDNAGKPLNAHPLSMAEVKRLADALTTDAAAAKNCFKSAGILPDNLLYLNNSNDGFAVWYTPAKKQQLLFGSQLHMTSGIASLPPLVWKASKHSLTIFALQKSEKPTETTPLYHAPFFNIKHDYSVCMGTVNINAGNCPNLQAFISEWQGYFFNSYFTHHISSESPTNTNLSVLWNQLIATGDTFPVTELKKNGKQLKDILK